jgi:hypothetical protein
MVEPQSSKLVTRVRFPSPAPLEGPGPAGAFVVEVADHRGEPPRAPLRPYEPPSRQRTSNKVRADFPFIYSDPYHILSCDPGHHH